MVTQNVDIMAQFSSHVRYYTATWYSDKSKVEILDTQTVEYGAEIKY